MTENRKNNFQSMEMTSQQNNQPNQSQWKLFSTKKNVTRKYSTRNIHELRFKFHCDGRPFQNIHNTHILHCRTHHQPEMKIFIHFYVLLLADFFRFLFLPQFHRRYPRIFKSMIITTFKCTSKTLFGVFQQEINFKISISLRKYGKY